MIHDLDDARLRRSFAYLAEQYMPGSGINDEPNFLRQQKRQEDDRRALVLAIEEFVDGTEDFCAERVSEIDRDLQRRDAYTLSFLREHFARR